MKKMLAARLYGKEDIRLEEVPIPEINENEILLKVKAASICGTDLRMYKNGLDGVNENNPRILCHEFAGTIEQIGKNVMGYTIGQRATVAPNIGCGICDLCVSGQSHHCSKLTAIGIHLDGGFAEYVKVPAIAVTLGNVTPIADSVSYVAAASNEALSCAYSAFERYMVNPGETVVIVGAGAIGLMHAKLAKMAGAAKIILNDISEERLRECAAIAPYIITIKDDLVNRINQETNGAGANVVITACSAAQAQYESFNLAGLDGRVNFFGGLPKGKEHVELDTNIIHYKQLTVTGTTRSSHEQYRRTLQFIAAGLLDVDSLITHKYPLDQIITALENAIKTVGLRHAIIFD
ncbi:MAG: alcohol dehydrogenase catalytic domain-containing protein [Defluviitaleaceae bacterium]|nr:alcohol dehydrogenase catalytic domain-containing protein [Defluviitaleaceae bacterium]